MPEPSQLRENEPHPVGPLTSRGQFLKDLAIDRRLSVHEAKKISFGHGLLESVRLRISYETQSMLRDRVASEPSKSQLLTSRATGAAAALGRTPTKMRPPS